MELELKVKGITRRWIVNVLSVVACVVIVIEILLGVFIQMYYYETAHSRAVDLSQGFSPLSTCSLSEFPDLARDYVEGFQYKDSMEIQIIDRNGNVIITSNGFQPVKEAMPDYDIAKKSSDGSGTWNGKSSIGESVMAQTKILKDYGNGSNGAVRWVISLREVNRRIVFLISICIVVGMGIITFSAFSGLYFIKSIVRPVQEVSNMARRIAMGDFKARLEVKENDEIGELCDTINYMASELGQAENIKNSFISSVSHELRTPLTAIRGWGETAKMSVGADDELVNKGLDVILNESQRLSGLVEELLDFSKMQSGRLSMNMRVTDILQGLKEAYDMYVELAKRQSIDLSFIKPAELPFVMGDPDRLKQVFINIIDNAIKYTNEGGHVLVEVYEEEGCVSIKISDTGVGIPEHEVDRVKEKFYKSNHTVRGSGIGLAVADEIVKQHKGLLFLESKEGVGTTVTVVLPIAEQQPEEEETTAVDYPPVSEQEEFGSPADEVVQIEQPEQSEGEDAQ